MKLHGLDSWIKVGREEIKLPLNEFEEKIDALTVLNSLVGLEVEFTKIITKDDVRFSIDFMNEDTRLNVMIIEENNAFIRIHFGFFALMSTPLYEHVANKYGIYSSAGSNKEIRNLLIVIEKILNDINNYSTK